MRKPKVDRKTKVETTRTTPATFSPDQWKIIQARLDEKAEDGNDIAHNNAGLKPQIVGAYGDK